MAFAMRESDTDLPVINPIFIHLTSYWDELAAEQLGHDVKYMNICPVWEDAEAYEVVNRINTRAYELEYAWRQSLRERRRVPHGLKIASDFSYRAFPFEVAYLILDRNVYFKGLGMLGDATIRFAETFVRIICEDSGISPQIHTFYDIRMQWDGSEDSYIMNRLIPDTSRSEFAVQEWRPVAVSPRYPRDYYPQDRSGLPGFPPEVLEVFYDFLLFRGKKIEQYSG